MCPRVWDIDCCRYLGPGINIGLVTPLITHGYHKPTNVYQLWSYIQKHHPGIHSSYVCNRTTTVPATCSVTPSSKFLASTHITTSKYTHHQVRVLGGNCIACASGRASTCISCYHTSCCEHCHATDGPPKIGPPDHLRQNMLLWMVPPDQVWLP